MATAAADSLVTRAIEALASAEPMTVDEVARRLEISPSALRRRVKTAVGLTPKELAQRGQLARFARALRAGDTVSEATYAAGFGSSRGVYQATRRGLGMTPSEVARRGARVRIGSSIFDSELGRVLVATTELGVCAVLLGDDDAELEIELRSRFERAELSGPARAEWVEAVYAHLADVRAPLGVPLDLRGTPFQLKVWRALRDIPAGERRTYAELARELGSPRAARAVGSACGSNAVAVLVPCHRVVRADGGLGGYRWGVARKRELLRREALDGA